VTGEAPASGRKASRAREKLDAAVREQLREAWERGLAAAPHGPGALADAGAPAGFAAIARAADDYAAAVADTWRQP
jgi:hypothetical protein